MKALPPEWTTTEMLANADAHTLEESQFHDNTRGVLMLRTLYELTPRGDLVLTAPVLYPAGTL